MKTIRDGSAVFTVRDKRMQAMVDMFYPIGSVYISADKSKTKADFPFMQYGIWEEVPADLCLQTGDASEAGTQRSAGLPNITGKVSNTRLRREGTEADGAFIREYKSFPDGSAYPYIWGENPGNEGETIFSFNASNSNSIYGSSTTVQPPSYMVRAWVRTS